MTELLDRPEVTRRAQARPAGASGQPPPRTPRPDRTAAVAVLVIAAILPFGRVFATNDWVVVLLLAGLAPVALSWVLRRLRLPWWVAALVTVIAWLWYTAVMLLPTTLWAGIVPTVATVRIAADAAVLAVQRIVLLPAPVYPETPLLLLAVTGVWWVATSIDVLALRLGAPGKAVICATTMWLVPLAIVPGGDAPSLLAVPLLLGIVLVMLADADRVTVGWGRVVTPTALRAGATPRRPSGLLLAFGAIVAGIILAGLLPGFGDPPWYQLRAQSTTTLTANPIVALRTNLVAQDTAPILRVRSLEPVYLRSTALDQYSENEEWTASEDGIELAPLGDGGVVPGAAFDADAYQVRVEALDLDGADLVPAPSGPIRFQAPDGVRPLYDPTNSTFVFEDEQLQTGQRYRVLASRPSIDPDLATTVSTPSDARLRQLPDGLPDEVGELARQIVDDAGATTPFMQALAIQDELRTWEYSLTPPPGHSGVAMRTFLENRVGYCEQFAGTMAVMLRTLDIPSRVAVGFTPGTVDPSDPTLWTVGWGNAHAWVEVKLAGEWLAFEPTPRTDGNVLVPTAGDLAPDQTLERPQTTSADAPQQFGNDQEQFDLFDEREALRNRALTEGSDVPTGGTGTQVAQRLADPTLVIAFGLLAVAALALLVRIGRQQARDPAPRARILSVRERVGRLGYGLGVPPPPWETDTEYLTRLAGGSEAGATLADACTQARYAPAVSVALAERAEQAGMQVADALVAGRPAWQRPLLGLRGDLRAGWRRLRRASHRSS